MNKIYKHKHSGDVFLIQSYFIHVPIWHYLKVDILKLPIFLKAVRGNANIDLAEFGEILSSGWGAAPPEYIRMQVEENWA